MTTPAPPVLGLRENWREFWLLGLINAYTSQYIGPALTNAMMFLVLVLMLMVRPQGLLGNAFGESR